MVTLTDFAQLIFRGRYIPFYITWADSVTFTMQIGEGEFEDSAGEHYFIQFEYHINEKKWIVAIYWDLEYAYIEELENADEYITQEEIKEIKAIVIREELSEYF